MKIKDRAANNVKLAHSLDLQLFNDDLIDPIDPSSAIDQDPVDPGEPTDPPAEPAPAVTADPTPGPVDITQTQAFARRLKEETERARQEARDAFVAEQYAGIEWNGKPITTEAELQQALFEQELQNAAGAGDIDLNQLINEHPDVKAARLHRESQQRQQKIFSEWEELQDEYPDISDFSKIPPEVYALKDQKGISLLDAYNRINIKKIKVQTEQETIRKLNQNAASSPGSVMDDGVVHKTKSVDEMTPEEFETYREEVRRRTRGE
jgi:hypothetical protein